MLQAEEMQKGGGNLLLVFLKVFVSFRLSFWNDFSLVKNYLSSISVSFDYVLWDFLFSTSF